MGCIFGLEMSRKAGEEKSLISIEALGGMLSESFIEIVFSGTVLIMQGSSFRGERLVSNRGAKIELRAASLDCRGDAATDMRGESAVEWRGDVRGDLGGRGDFADCVTEVVGA